MTLMKLPDLQATLRLQTQSPIDLPLGRRVLRAKPLKMTAMKLLRRIRLRRCQCLQVLRLDLCLCQAKRAQANLTTEQRVARGSPVAPHSQTRNQALVCLARRLSAEFHRFLRTFRRAARVFRQFAYRSTDPSRHDLLGRRWEGFPVLNRIVARSARRVR